MRNISFWPTIPDASSVRRVSSCEIGQKPRTPATVTSTPPLLTAVIVPSTGSPSSNARASSAGACAPDARASWRRSTIGSPRPPASTTVASIAIADLDRDHPVRVAQLGAVDHPLAAPVLELDEHRVATDRRHRAADAIARLDRRRAPLALVRCLVLREHRREVFFLCHAGHNVAGR